MAKGKVDRGGLGRQPVALHDRRDVFVVQLDVGAGATHTPSLHLRGANSKSRAVEAALADTRVVVVLGARQVGKSTLLEQVAAAEGIGREVLTLDDQAIRSAASIDPAGFIATLDTPVAGPVTVKLGPSEG